jgi:uncharacterized membrane protein YkgB
MQSIGKVLILVGVIMVILGVLLLLGSRFPMLGKLPGDIVIQRRNFTFYFPITTLIILNMLIMLIMWLFRKFSGN